MGEKTTCFSTTKDADGNKYWAKFDQNSFAEGAFRYAFKGILYGNGPRNNTACVVKMFQGTDAGDYSAMLPDLAACNKVAEYLKEFNEIRFLTGIINVVFPLIAKLKRVDKYTSIEPYLDGTFVKFNNNWGWESQSDSLMTAFSHWTWFVSGHEELVCDIQGVKEGNTYTLTDPAIHSVGQLYGLTDHGERGMRKVLDGHTCNTICNMLALHKPVNGGSSPTIEHHTKFTFESTEED